MIIKESNLEYIMADKCTYDEVYLFMASVEKDFVPSLFQRIDVEQYVTKILNKATIITCRQNSKIIGMVVFYNNDFISRKIYITYLAVDSLFRKQNVASKLLGLIDIKAKQNKMQYIHVSTCNPIVVEFYKKNKYNIV